MLPATLLTQEVHVQHNEYCALLDAVGHDREAIVRVLLENNADVNLADSIDMYASAVRLPDHEPARHPAVFHPKVVAYSCTPHLFHKLAEQVCSGHTFARNNQDIIQLLQGSNAHRLGHLDAKVPDGVALFRVRCMKLMSFKSCTSIT